MPIKDLIHRRAVHARYMREVYYPAHRVEHIKLVAKRKHKYIASRRTVVNAYKCVPCMDCKQTFDTIAMDFDHVRGIKVANVSHMIMGQFALAKIIEEISKCDIVCANCHRVRTLQRRKTRI